MKLPDINRKEWRELLTGEINVPLKNFFFQMKVTQTKNFINQGRVSIEDAVKDIYGLCSKFSNANHLEEDLKVIFKNEKIQHTSVTRVDSISNNEEVVDAKRKTTANKEQIERIKEEAEKKQKELEKVFAERKRIEALLANEKIARERLLKERIKDRSIERARQNLDERLIKESNNIAKQEQKKNEETQRTQESKKPIDKVEAKENHSPIQTKNTLYAKASEPSKYEKQNVIKENEKNKILEKRTISSFFRSIFIVN